MTTDHEERRTNFEQRIQTGIQLLICLLIAWGGNSLVDVKAGLATMQATSVLTNTQTAKDIAELKSGLEAVKTQSSAAAVTASNATAAATAATTAATTAAAVAATAVSTAAALAAGTKKTKVN